MDEIPSIGVEEAMDPGDGNDDRDFEEAIFGVRKSDVINILPGNDASDDKGVSEPDRSLDKDTASDVSYDNKSISQISNSMSEDNTETDNEQQTVSSQLGP